MLHAAAALALISIYFLFADTLTRISIGPVSLNAVASVGIAATLALYSPILIPRYRALPLGFRIVTAWMPISLILAALNRDPVGGVGGLSVAGVQQFLAWLLFVGSILVGYVAAPGSFGVRRFTHRLIMAGSFWAVLAIVLHPADAIPGDRSLMIGARPLAALLVLSLSLSWARFTLNRQAAYLAASGVMFFGIVATQSRSATAAGILSGLMIGVADVDAFRPRTWPRLFYGMLFLLAAVGLTLTYAPLRERLVLTLLLPTALASASAGPEATVITQGRSKAWPGLLAHACESPLWGHGMGSGSAYTYYLTGNERFAHPHNEYLRLFHDTGAVGLLAWVVGFVSVWLSVWRAHRRARHPAGTARHSVALSLIGLIPGYMLLFATDNIGFYTFVMVPLGTLVGLALNFHGRLKLRVYPAGVPAKTALGTVPYGRSRTARGRNHGSSR